MNTSFLSYDDLFAGASDAIPDQVTIAAGSGILARGTVLNEVAFAIGTPVAKVGNSCNGVLSALALGANARAGNYTVRCTALEAVAGTAQVETASVVGTVTADTGAGNVEVIVTAAGIVGFPKTYHVPVAAGDGNTAVGGKIRAVLAADADLTALYTVGGSGANCSLTQKHLIGNDATLNIAYDNGTCTGLTGDASSTDTTAGVAATPGIFEVLNPEGERLDDANVGVAYSDQVRFTVLAGTAAFAIGDTITLPVTAVAPGTYTIANSANVALEGAPVVYCVLAETVDATSAVQAEVYRSGEFNASKLIFGGADTLATHINRMLSIGIVPKGAVPAASY